MPITEMHQIVKSARRRCLPSLDWTINNGPGSSTALADTLSDRTGDQRLFVQFTISLAPDGHVVEASGDIHVHLEGLQCIDRPQKLYAFEGWVSAAHKMTAGYEWVGNLPSHWDLVVGFFNCSTRSGELNIVLR